ncbi:MAG: hypothetical protein Q9183_002786 [Haloplaca sp. 2 TL-2023]
MGTPHRGLPPPSAMMQNPDRGGGFSSSSGSSVSIGNLPSAPERWQGAEESMRNWLQAKSEEDRRKQEEQKTQQESLKLEQRKVEQSILRDSLQGGIPPYMVPMVFAGMGGGSLPNVALEWAQHAMASITLQQQAQMQQQQQVQQQPQQQSQQQQQQQQQANQASAQNPTEQRRMITGPQPNPYGAQQMQQPPPPPAPPQNQANVAFVPSYQTTNASVDRNRLAGPSPSIASSTSTMRTSSTLPRLNTVDPQVQQPNQAYGGLQIPPQHPMQQTQQVQQQEQQQQQASSPIYFHHWVPPNTQTSSNKDPGTPGGKSQHESPFSQTQSSYLRSDYTNSPKKRKATGAHQAAPPPSSGPNQTSPSFSHTSSGSQSGRRRNRSRNHSDASSRAINDVAGYHRHRSRTASGRQSVSEAESSNQRRNSAQTETRPSQSQQYRPAGPAPTQEQPHEASGRQSPKREPKEPSQAS